MKIQKVIDKVYKRKCRENDQLLETENLNTKSLSKHGVSFITPNPEKINLSSLTVSCK